MKGFYDGNIGKDCHVIDETWLKGAERKEKNN